MSHTRSMTRGGIVPVLVFAEVVLVVNVGRTALVYGARELIRVRLELLRRLSLVVFIV